MILYLYKCIIGPRLYRLQRTTDSQGVNYKATNGELISDGFIRLISVTWNVGIYASPIILSYFYRRYQPNSLPTHADNYQTIYKTVVTFLLAIAGAFIIRGFSRYQNTDYREFINVLDRLRTMPREKLFEFDEVLNKYDFDFRSWPVIFKWEDSPSADPKRPPEVLKKQQDLSALDKLKKLPFTVLSYLAIKLFGRRMMYPGSVDLLQKMMQNVLDGGRYRLIEHYQGKRYKLQAVDGNEIDTLFIDNRGKNAYGNTLVVCCEGNAGFYEIGITATPIAAGYSTLGFNHPGFGGSTGEPYPQNEVNAIDTVMKFAIDKLGFKQENIIVFAWSIGGYCGSWAAMQYPEIKGLILDATFDDVVDLAVAKLPSSWKPLVIDAVSTYFNLNISEQLNQFHGPILVIRRTMDEIININPEEPIKTNRSNDILVKLFRNRFPALMNDEKVYQALRGWLERDRMWYPYRLDNEKALLQLKQYIDKNGVSYPVNIGDELETSEKINIILYLAQKTLVDFNTTHCTPLDVSYLQTPWNILSLPAFKRKL